MITEDYVSFEVAKLLKEKGFDELCSHYIVSENALSEFSHGCLFKNSDSTDNDLYCCPTHQMAMKWLREVYGIAIEPMLLSNGWFCQIERILEDFCKKYIDETDSYKTYEESVVSAIKYCLENLL